MIAKPVLVPFLLAAVTRFAAVLLVAAGTGWGQWTVTEEAKLHVNALGAGDQFGKAVAASGDAVLVGVLDEDSFVFARKGTTWPKQQKLITTQTGSNSHSVALSGDTALVGSPVDSAAGEHQAGATYVFLRNGATWTQAKRLTASNASTLDSFGISVALSGDTAVIGALQHETVYYHAGSAYVFVGSGATWSQQQEIVPGDPSASARFGNSVGVSGDTAVVGAQWDDGNNGDLFRAGSAYVFVRDGTTWTEQAKLTASDAAEDEQFGTVVAVSGDRIVVGVPFAGAADAGAVYVFARNGTSWTEEAKFAAADTEAGDQFGSSLALVGDELFVGAPRDTHAGGANAGSAYMFVHGGSGWTETVKFTASDATDGDELGTSVAVSGHVVVVGADRDDGSGSAYVFRLCPPQVTNWATYCTAGISSSGCQAVLSACGNASASAPTGFDLIASSVEGASGGLFYFGASGQQANPWGNGTSLQCVVPPVTRAGIQPDTGTNGACDASFLQDLNAFWCSSCPKPAKNPGAGSSVQAQLWYRDPLSTSNQTTSLSDAIEFGVGP